MCAKYEFHKALGEAGFSVDIREISCCDRNWRQGVFSTCPGEKVSPRFFKSFLKEVKEEYPEHFEEVEKFVTQYRLQLRDEK